MQQQNQAQTPPGLSDGYLPIEDYGIIGDLHTVALIGKNGSIDWCCIPRFDAPSVFGALLDSQKGGFFRLAPPYVPGMTRKQIYIPDTNILITRFLSVSGVCEVIDFMPIKEVDSKSHQHHIIRSVHVVRGSMPIEMVCKPAFNYARDTHEVHLSKDGAIFTSQHLCLGLASTVPVEEDGQGGVHATHYKKINMPTSCWKARKTMISHHNVSQIDTIRSYSRAPKTTGNTGLHSVNIKVAGVKPCIVRPSL